MYKESVKDTPLTFVKSAKPLGGNWSQAASYNVKRLDSLRTSGTDTPNFHARKRRGELLPFTAFLQLEQKTTTSPPNIWNHYRFPDGTEEKWSGYMYPEASGDVVSWTASSSLGDGKTNPEAIMQQAAAKTSGDWDVLTFAAEMGQTVSMFAGLLTKVINLIRLKPPGTPWNVWLELRYGWRTLAFEMQDIEKAFSRQSKSKFSRASAGQSISWVVSSSSSIAQSYYTMTSYKETKYSMNTRGRVVVKGDLPRFKIDLLSTAWEVTRLSFVVDWFINIGRWIDAMQFTVSGREYAAGIGDQITVEENTWRTFAMNPGYTLLASNTLMQRIAVIQRRGPASIPLSPLHQLNIDRWKVVDLLALLVQAIWRK